MLIVNMLLWSLLAPGELGQPAMGSVWFRGRVQDHQSHKWLPAVWRWADSANHTLLERKATAGGFADFAPRQAQFLTISSDGYRPVRLPVQWPRGRSDTVRFRAIIPLVPVDKMSRNRPYFQSQQRPLRLSPAARTGVYVPVHFVVCDALTNQPVPADLCLFFTRTHYHTCYATHSLRTKLAQPDIVAVEARAPGYQLYLGNVIVSELAANAVRTYTIRLNPTPTVFMATVLGQVGSGNFRLKAMPFGPVYRTVLFDSTCFTTVVQPGRYQFTGTVGRRHPIRDTVQLGEGLNGYVYPVDRPGQFPEEPLERIIYFAQSSYELSDLAKQQLDQVANVMQQQTNRHVCITGHTDNLGDRHLNKVLSEFRARTTKAYLLHQGIQEERLHSEAAGSSQPASPNDAEEHRWQNRRVSVRWY